MHDFDMTVPTQRPFGGSLPAGLSRGPGRRPIKVFLYSHDTFGLGHLRRNLALAERLLAVEGEFSVFLLTGSPVIGQWRLPPGLQVQALPPVVKTGAERYEAREAGHVFGLVKGYREALILKLVLAERPDVFLVDHAPAGMNGELLATLALIRRELPSTRVMLGLRDILDSPETVRKLWREQDIYALLEQAYDDILVYGSRALFDVAAGYAMPTATARRVRYCGHVVAADEPRPIGGVEAAAGPAATLPCWDLRKAASRPVVLVTAGGGGDGFFMMRAYMEALEQMPAGRFYSVIVAGPLMAPHERDYLRKAVSRVANAELVDFTTNLMPSLRAANLVVAMAGYNTSAEIIAEQKRAILVPRAAPRAEQLMRASLLARLGLVTMLEPDENLVAQFAARLPEALSAKLADATAWGQLDLNGAERLADYLRGQFMASQIATPVLAARELMA